MMTFVCSLPLIGALFAACQPPAPLAVGYVEGEYVLIAPVETAQIATLEVRRGDRIVAGQPLVEMERRDAEIAVAAARAARAAAASQLANLRQGKRPEEIAVIGAALASARAQREVAERERDRQRDLFRRGITTQSQFDTVSTNLDVAVAKVAEMEASLAVSKLPAREDEIGAAAAALDQARANEAAAEWRLGKRTLTSPKPGAVYDVIRNPGEVAGAQAPVLSVLPDDSVKLRLYVPESALSQVALGTVLKVHCDGCGAGMTATVNYVSPDPEFTPPVIYSRDTRNKLSYLIEARPDAASSALKPGQIVDVVLAGGRP
jgi:HlyD family secretion protein